MKSTVFVVLGLAVAAGLAWLLLERGQPTPNGPLDDAAPAISETRPELHGVGGERPDDGKAATTRAPGLLQPTLEEALGSGGPLLLEGRISGWDRSLPGELRIEVKRADGDGAPDSWRAPAVLALGGTLTFSMDVSRMVQTEGGELQIAADHPAYLAFAARVHSAEARGGRLHVDIALKRAGGIRGRVESPDGQAVVGADVGVFPLTDGRPARQAVEAVKSGADGSFRLRVGAKGRYLVGARTGARRPAAAEVDVAPGSSADLGALVLEDGVSVSGVVRYRGLPLAGAVVDLATKADEVSLALGEGRALWSEGRLHHRYLQAKTDAEGRYAFEGLSPGAYSIAVSGGDAIVLHFTDVRDGGREVHAPARNVDFDLAAMRLVAEVRCDGRPLPGLDVWMNSLVEMEGLPEDDFAVFGYYPTVTDGEGRVTVHVSPGARYMFGIDHDAYERGTEFFVTPKTGTEHRHVVVVERKPERPKLKVTLVGPGAEDLTRASFGFWPHGKGPAQQTAFPVRQVDCKGGLCLLEDLEPGRWTMRARPGRGWWEGFSHYVETVIDVDLPRSGTAEIEVPVRIGGSLRITAKDEDGRMLGPTCKVFDAEGNEVGVSFFVRSERGLVHSTRSMLAGAPNRVVQALLPGVYEVRFTEQGYRPKTVKTTIDTQQTTSLVVVLESTR